MDWLFDHGIVFDILPDDESVKEIADQGQTVQALACLTYLEHEPEKENIPLLGILFTLMVGVGGLALDHFLPENFLDLLSEALLDILPAAISATAGNEPIFFLAATLLIVGLLILVGAISKKNYAIRGIAAWANSWSTAIKAYMQNP